MLLTHFGISGPNVFALSALLAFEKIAVDNPFTVTLIPEAEMNYDAWLQKLSEQSSKDITTLLKSYFPQRLASAILTELHITPSLPVHKELVQKIARFLSGGWKVQLVMRRPGDEFVTAGGVSLDEIDPEIMGSKICPGLYFAGEILDVDGVTGGFNLQACWAAGRCAGMAIAGLL